MLEGYAFRGNEKVLDVGCGDGKITAHIANNLAKGEALGIDISPSMIEFANKNFGQEKNPNLRFQIQDAAKLQVPSDFDLVVSFSVMQWVIEQKKALLRMHDALKLNGRLLISMPAGYPEAMTNALKGIMADTTWKNYFADFKLAQVFYKQDEYATLLKNCGFQNIKVEILPMFDDFPSTEAFSNFVKQWLPHLQVIPSEKRDAFMKDLMERYVGFAPPNANGQVRFSKYTLEASAEKGDPIKNEL